MFHLTKENCVLPIPRHYLPLPRDLDDVYKFLSGLPPEFVYVARGMAHGTAAQAFPFAPQTRHTVRPRRRLPTRRSWRERWQFAYTTPTSAVPGTPYSSTNYNAAAVNDILYLLSGQP